MKNLIDTEKLIECFNKEIKNYNSTCDIEQYDAKKAIELLKFAISSVKHQLTVDTIVRCKNCKWIRKKTKNEKEYLCENVLICTNADVSEDGWCTRYPEDFCSYGENIKGEKMIYPISTIKSINWYKKCTGCYYNVSQPNNKTDERPCKYCCNCPYAICGSHENMYKDSMTISKEGN